jgi:DNA-binding GntR family transcriptional regulator
MAIETSAQRLAYLHVRDSIVAGYLSPGAKIASEVIADILGVSRMPVRDALYQLDAEGFVQIFPNRGAYVRAYTSEEIVDLSEMRAVLEGLAGRLAVERMTDNDIVEIEYLLERTRRCANDHREFLKRHDEFHLYIYEFSGREHLVAEIRRLRLVHHSYMLAFFTATQEQEILGYEHDLIVDELKRRNGTAIELGIRTHVMQNAHRVAKFAIKDEKSAKKIRFKPAAAPSGKKFNVSEV